MVFGGVMAWDLVSLRHRRVQPAPKRFNAFVAQRLGRAPSRTYGRVAVSEAGISFSYRPWLILPRQTVLLPPGSYRLGRGLVCPVVQLQEAESGAVAVLRLPPRYRYHEDEVVRLLGLAGIEDLALRRGIRAAIDWMREMAGRGGREAARLAGQARERVGA